MIILRMLNVDVSSPQGGRTCLNSVAKRCYNLLLEPDAALLVPDFSVSFQICIYSFPQPLPKSLAVFS